MKKISFFVLVLACAFQFSNAQEVELSGKVIAKGDVENIHVINKTSQKFTTTNASGEFKISGEVNDTLLLSSIRYELFSTRIKTDNILTKSVIVKLEERVNELDEVVVGKVLTGSLDSDIINSDAEPDINFYDVGIPGYKGKPKTQNERRLQEAGEFKPKQLLGVLASGAVPLHPILNAISGRTKMLKERVRLETEASLIATIKSRLSKDFFEQFPLEEDKQMEFLYFCSDDENFQNRCKGKSDIEVIEFLKEKYKVFMQNLSNDKN